MPDLRFERENLREADQHIAIAIASIASMERNLEEARVAGADLAPFENALRAARNSLGAFQAHRQLIVATISDIEEGRLPSI